MLTDACEDEAHFFVISKEIIGS